MRHFHIKVDPVNISISVVVVLREDLDSDFG